jgi:hypothetical protein
MTSKLTKVSDTPIRGITPADVDRLREEWLQLDQQATDLELDFAKNAEAYGLGHPGDATVGPRAAVSAARNIARKAWLEYQDALARLQSVQADDQARRSDELARTNTDLAQKQFWLALVIGLATIVQAVAAVRQLFQEPPPAAQPVQAEPRSNAVPTPHR